MLPSIAGGCVREAGPCDCRIAADCWISKIKVCLISGASRVKFRPSELYRTRDSNAAARASRC